MKKYFVCLIFGLLCFQVYASPYADGKMEEFMSYLKKAEYAEGIRSVLSGTALEEKVLDRVQTKNDWIYQFEQIELLYGNFLDYEKLFSQRLGEIEETYYFVYCETYLIQIIVTEYRDADIINFVFNDSIIDTLHAFGKITAGNGKEPLSVVGMVE